MSKATKDERVSSNQVIEKLKLKSECIKSEIHVEKGLTEQSIVDSARSRSRLRRLGNELEENTKDMDAEIKHLEWALELSNQEQAKIQVQIESAKVNLEGTISKFAQQLQQKKAEHAEQEALLRTELQMYQTELESLREFQSQRAQVEEELRNMDQTLVQQRQVHQETMEQLRQQLSREKKQFEEENKRRVNDAKNAALHMKDETLEAAAIRCIQDSTSIANQLKKIQAKSKEVLTANQGLIKRIDDMKRENQLLEDRKKMLENDVAKYRKRIEAIRQQLSDHEVSHTKERAQIETESAYIIESLKKEIEALEKDTSSYNKQLEYTNGRIEQVEGQKRMTSNEMSQLMDLISTTAPVVLESLSAKTNSEDQPEPLKALITKLTEAVEEAPPSARVTGSRPSLLVSHPIQTENPKMKYF